MKLDKRLEVASNVFWTRGTLKSQRAKLGKLTLAPLDFVDHLFAYTSFVVCSRPLDRNEWVPRGRNRVDYETGRIECGLECGYRGIFGEKLVGDQHVPIGSSRNKGCCEGLRDLCAVIRAREHSERVAFDELEAVSQCTSPAYERKHSCQCLATPRGNDKRCLAAYVDPCAGPRRSQKWIVAVRVERSPGWR